MTESELKMLFHPNMLEHLGGRMYSTLPQALAELIANAYDADATQVLMILNDTQPDNYSISIEDNGIGMSFDDLNTNFLNIGRNRRTSGEGKQITSKGRKVIGKKGLGKLSFFGIAQEMQVTTIQNNLKNSFIMRWEHIISTHPGLCEYKPEIIEHNEKCTQDSGTIITLKKIKRDGKFSADNIATKLSQLFNFSSDFSVSIKHNDKLSIHIDNKRRYSGLDIQFKWEIPKETELVNKYITVHKIKGELITTKNLIESSHIELPGVTLLSRNKMVNAPDFFSTSTASHFASYITGWLDVDYIDDLKDDVIATNRQSLIWGHKEMLQLRQYLGEMLNKTHKLWRQQRKEIKLISTDRKS